VLALFLLIVSGCATKPTNERAPIEMTTDPAGAKVYIDDTYIGETPLQVRLDGSRDQIVIFRKGGYREETVHGFNCLGPVLLHLSPAVAPAPARPVFDAVSRNDEKTLRALISQGVNVDEPGGAIPLHEAARRGFLPLVGLLLEAGADLSSKDPVTQRTALHEAADGMLVYDPRAGFWYESPHEMVRFLIARGAPVNVRDKDGATPLHYAARDLQLLSVAALVEAGADVNAVANDGSTPLGNAMKGWRLVDMNHDNRGNDDDVLDYLKSKGANPKSVDTIGMGTNRFLEKAPPGVLARWDELHKANHIDRLPSLAMGLDRDAVMRIVGPMHSFRNKASFIDGRLVYTAVWTWWDVGTVHRCFFEIPEPAQGILNVAGRGGSMQLALPPDEMSGGRLVRYTLNDQRVDLPRLELAPGQMTLQFYESDENRLPKDKRSYATTFSADAVRYINMEAKIPNSDPSRRIDFSVTCVYRSPDGTEFARFVLTSAFEQGWKYAWYNKGWGSKKAGTSYKQRGRYQVELFYQGASVATGEFEIQ
jgi:hypothetical protein